MKTIQSLSKNSHLENLTWLRAIAAVFVVVSHSIRFAEIKYAPNDEKSYFLPINLLDLGSFGVCLFFALSGCALYLSNKDGIKSLSDFSIFYLKRFMRIWPAFAFSMVLYLVFIELFRMGDTGNNQFLVAKFLKEYTSTTIVSYLSLTFNITGPSDIFIGPYWSLPVEFQYYLVLPFAISLMSNRFTAILIPVVFSGVLYAIYKYQLVNFYRVEVFQLGYTFFGGVLLAYIYQDVKTRISPIVGFSAFAVLVWLAGLIVNSRLAIPDNVLFFSDAWNCYGILAILCVALALFSKTPLLPKTVTSFLNEYGEISYSIYLFHMLFIGVSAIAITRFEIYGSLQKLSFILAFTFFFSFLFSRLTYKYIELPSIKFGKILSETIKTSKRRLTAYFLKSL
jgi:peptidoglycan/LPS O-acetylase OafA/YrhL